MHWRPDVAAGADEGVSVLRVVSAEAFEPSTKRIVHDTLERVQKCWKKEFKIEMEPRADFGHASYTLSFPADSHRPPTSGLLTLALGEPDLSDASDGQVEAWKQATQRAVGQAVDTLASKDILFLSRRRLKRRQHAPSVAQKLSWMLCRIGNEEVLKEAGCVLDVVLNPPDVQAVAAASSKPLVPPPQQQSQEAEGSEDEPEAAASDEPEGSAYSRVLSGLTDGLTRHLNNQLKEACPQPPSQREAYRPQNRHRKKRCVNPAHEPAHVGAPDQQPSSPMQTDGSGHGTAQVRVG